MSYVDKNLLPGEVIQHRAKVHWAALAPRLLGTVAVFCLSRGFDTNGIWLSLVFLFGVVAVIDFAVVRWTTEIGVTNGRLILKRGLISRRTAEVRLEKVETINVSQGILGRILGFGDVRIVGSGGTNERVPWVGNPVGLRNAVTQAADAKAAT